MASMSLDPPPQPQPTTTQAAHHERTIHQHDHLHQRCRQALHSLLPPHPQPQLLPPTLMWSSWTPALPCPTCYAHALPALHSNAHGLQSLRISTTSSSTGLPSATVLPTSTARVPSSGLPPATSPGLPPAAATPRLPWPGSGLSASATTCSRLPRLSSTARRPWPAPVEVDFGEK